MTGTGRRGFAPAPPWHLVERAVAVALEEDLGLTGDVTTQALVDSGASGLAEIRFRAPGVLAGTWVADALCARFDLMVAWDAVDGDEVAAGEVAGELEGSLADILSAERTLLNFLCHLSGVATATRRFVTALVEAGGEDAPLLRDTRKTTPGLRALEKAAVRAGGGVNHRMGLYDAILVKDNHLVAFGGDMTSVVAEARERYPGVPLEIEADTLEQAVAAAEAGCELVLLDNMSPASVAAVVAAVGGMCALEISGGLTLETVAEYATCGADYVAVGAITHSAPVVDIGLDLVSRTDAVSLG